MTLKDSCGNHLNNKPSHKSNHVGIRDKSSDRMTMPTIRYKMKLVRTAENGHSYVKKIEGYRFNKE